MRFPTPDEVAATAETGSPMLAFRVAERCAVEIGHLLPGLKADEDGWTYCPKAHSMSQVTKDSLAWEHLVEIIGPKWEADISEGVFRIRSRAKAEAEAFAEALNANLKMHAARADQDGWMIYGGMDLPATVLKGTPNWAHLEAACLKVGLRIDHEDNARRTIKVKFVPPA